MNRALHFLGTTLSLLALVASLALAVPLWLLAVPVAGYGPAWVGHFLFEKNKPATFQHPLWSLRGDCRMYGFMWTGRMGAEVLRLTHVAA